MAHTETPTNRHTHTYRCVYAMSCFMLFSLSLHHTLSTHGFPVSSELGRKPFDVLYVSDRTPLSIGRGRKSLSTVWCERVKVLWAIYSTVAVVTWTRDEERMGTGGLLCLHAHSDWENYGRLEGSLILLSVDDSMFPVCLNHTHTNTPCAKGGLQLMNPQVFPPWSRRGTLRYL